MRNLALNLAAIISLLGMIVCLCLGVVMAAGGEWLIGLTVAILGSPVCLALAVVFDFVGEKIRRQLLEGNFRGKEDAIDTPWENNPNHF